MASPDEKKRQVAEAALGYVKAGMLLGLGSGSTARYFLEGVGRLVSEGLDLKGVPTSLATAEAAKQLGVPLTSLEENPRLDLCVDGADEVDPKLNLVKGLGGALFREKIVAAASEVFLVIVDDSKLVPRLGKKVPVPVEVHPFGWRASSAALERLGAKVELRRKDDQPYRTDNDNLIFDARFASVRSWTKLAAGIAAIPGVIAHGLFLGMADTALAGTDEGVKTLSATRTP